VSYPDQSSVQQQPVHGGFYTTQSAQQVEAEKAAQMSLICGILGLFFFGIILGPIAIIQANKAEKLGKAATAGKVLGWIDAIFGVIGLIVFFVTIAGVLAAGSSGF
jgi:uncharacterized Tic20 family protein